MVAKTKLDNVGNVITLNPGGGYNWTYGYDNIYQVTSADQGSATNRAVDFNYDGVYNRTSWYDTQGNISVMYGKNSMNQYTQVGMDSVNYDNRGNVTSTKYNVFMSYDCENRMTSAVSGAVQYDYDLLGRRNLKLLAGYIDLVYVWDGAHIIAEYWHGTLQKKYIYGPGMDNPVAMINVSGTSETWYYYYPDALGSIRMMSNASGAIVESYAYDPYGKPSVMTSAGSDGNWLTEDVSFSTNGYGNAYSLISNPYMFTARRWDDIAGLYYYRFRDFSPTLGRFLQPDPAKYIDGMNIYAYCGNNPINKTDPLGLVGYSPWPGHPPISFPQQPPSSPNHKGCAPAPEKYYPIMGPGTWNPYPGYSSPENPYSEGSGNMPYAPIGAGFYMPPNGAAIDPELGTHEIKLGLYMGAGAIAGAKGGFAGAALGALGGAICFVADEIHEYMMQPQPQPQSQQEDGSVKPKDH